MANAKTEHSRKLRRQSARESLARGERIDAIRGNIGKVATRDADVPNS